MWLSTSWIELMCLKNKNSRTNRINMYEEQNAIPKPMANAAGNTDGTSVRNAVVMAAITDASSNDSPREFIIMGYY
tara:strand:- start:10004 stop:10231 length:228 start_codon:yes stop_codon:yes gene_type:complete